LTLTSKHGERQALITNSEQPPTTQTQRFSYLMEIQQLNLNTAILQLGDDFGSNAPSLIAHINTAVLAYFNERIINTIPAYTSLLVEFSLQHHTMANCLTELEQQAAAAKSHYQTHKRSGRIVDIPVYYHPSVGHDLEQIMHSKNISLEHLIKLHTGVQYQVQAVGFIPGFAYLGELDPALHTNRLARPRANVPKGSVAIAEQQTAVYPRATPGGWHIIGRTPIDVFHITPKGDIAHTFELGDTVQFRSISETDFFALGGDLSNSAQAAASAKS